MTRNNPPEQLIQKTQERDATLDFEKGVVAIVDNQKHPTTLHSVRYMPVWKSELKSWLAPVISELLQLS